MNGWAILKDNRPKRANESGDMSMRQAGRVLDLAIFDHWRGKMSKKPGFWPFLAVWVTGKAFPVTSFLRWVTSQRRWEVTFLRWEVSRRRREETFLR